MLTELKIGDFLLRKKIPVKILPDEEYSLVTVKLYHKGVILREKKKGSLIGSNMNRVSAGDFILSGIDARNGAFGIVPEDLDGAIVTNDFWYFDVDESKVKRDFFYWLTTTPLFLDACQKSSKGETQRIRLQKDLFNEFVFQFPPVEEQDSFLQSFGSIDKSLSTLKNESANQSSYLTKLRQAILQEAIEGKLTESWRKKNPVRKGDPDYDSEALLEKIQAEKEKLIKEGKIKKQKPLAPIKAEDVPFELPAGWVWCRAPEIKANEQYSLGIGPFGSDLVVSDYRSTGTPLIFVRNITNNDFSLSRKFVSAEKAKSLNAHKVIGGDVLITKMGDPPGDTAIYPNHNEPAIITADCIRLRAHKQISCKYLVYALKSNLVIKQILTITRGMGQKKVSLERFIKLFIPLPPRAEQQAIVDRVENLLSIVDELEKQVSERKEQSEQLMQAVLREAFEGGK
jgi:type I restriction enzyme, S subunit